MLAKVPKFQSKDALSQYANRFLLNQVKQQQIQFTKDFGDEKPDRLMTLEVQMFIGVAKPGLISVYQQYYTYTGGAHPNTSYTGWTFGLVDGKPQKLKFANIQRTRMDSFAQYTQIVLPVLNDLKKARGVDQVFELPRENMDNFVVTPGGITWLFSPYDVGAYAEGPFFAKVSAQELKGKVTLQFDGGTEEGTPGGAMDDHSAGTGLEGTDWVLAEFAGHSLPSRLPSIKFDKGGRVSGNATVNRIMGSFTKKGSSLKFGPMATTEMAGSPEAMKFESHFVKALSTVDGYALKGGKLVLTHQGKTVAVFSAKG
jgi:heat shock protein HslJ